MSMQDSFLVLVVAPPDLRSGDWAKLLTRTCAFSVLLRMPKYIPYIYVSIAGISSLPDPDDAWLAFSVGSTSAEG